MSSNKPIQGVIGPDGAKVPYPLHPGQQVTATLTLNQPADVMLVLTCDGVDKAWDEGSGPSLWRNIKDPVTIEKEGAWVFEIRRYSESDAPVGIGWMLRPNVTAAPVQPALFKALTISLASEWRAKLENMQGVGGSAIAIKCHGVEAWDILGNGPDFLTDKNLVIVGHHSVWHDSEIDIRIIARLINKPLLLQGDGGKQFAHVAGLLLRGAVWSGETEKAEVTNLDPVFNSPYPMNVSGPGEFPLYEDFQPVYAVDQPALWKSYLRVSEKIVVGKIEKQVGYFGLIKVGLAESWEIFCNLATDLAARGKQP